jgi:hypothetical protein
MAIWYNFPPFGIFSPFGYVAPRNIWQPWSDRETKTKQIFSLFQKRRMSWRQNRRRKHYVRLPMESRQPGTDDMILRNIFAKQLGENIGVFFSNCC